MFRFSPDDMTLINTAIATLIVAVLVRVSHMISNQNDMKKKLDDATDKVETVRSQVQNDHGTNLRDDMDKLMRQVTSLDTKVDDMSDRLGKERHYRSAKDAQLELRLKKLERGETC